MAQTPEREGEKLIRLEDALRVCFDTCAIISKRDTLANDKKTLMVTVATSIMTELQGVKVVKTKMPRQKPGESEQDVETPPDFLEAVVKRFGPIAWDLATRADNAKAPNFFTPEQDSLKQNWATLSGNLYLNPRFKKIRPWANKCAAAAFDVSQRGWIRAPDIKISSWRLMMLTPASVGANWYIDYLHQKALVLSLTPRIKFIGHTHVFPKDLILSVFGEKPGFEVWKWK